MVTSNKRRLDALLRYAYGVDALEVTAAPPKLVAWNVFILAVAEAVHWPHDWDLEARLGRRRNQFAGMADRLFRQLLVDAKWGGAASQRAKARLRRLINQEERLAASIAAHVAVLKLWEEYLHDARVLLWLMGQKGLLRGAVTFSAEGVLHPIQLAAWANQENFEAFTARREIDAGDVPLSPLGTPFIPIDTLNEWLRLIKQHKPLTIPDLHLILEGGQLPDETVKEWLFRRGVHGPLLLDEALPFAREQHPDADLAALKVFAKAIQTASSRLAGETNSGVKKHTRRSRRNLS